MRIAIIGAGNVGGTLGRVWSTAGHEVVFGVRDPQAEKARAAVRAAGGRARAAFPADAAAEAEVVLLATPWQATVEAVEGLGSLAGKVVIDATNPLKPDLSGLLFGHDTSAAEEVAHHAHGAMVVKAFNTIGAKLMDHPELEGMAPTMFVCGDDVEAKRVAMGLAEDAGFDPVDAGALPQARLLEALAMLWISLAHVQGLGTDIAIRLLRG